MPIYLVAYSGIDESAHQQLREIFSHLDGIYIVMPLSDIKPDHKADIVIVDCRNEILSLTEPFSQNRIPSIALTNDIQTSREAVFKCGYYDYIGWPLLGDEVLRRVSSGLMLAMQETAVKRFSNINLVEQACRYMSDHISDTISLKSLCVFLGTNRNKLSKNFKLEFGVGPLTWLRIHRMQTAAYQLIKTEKRIIYIALSVGYQDANNFSTSFKKLNGHSPSGYRKKMRNSKISVL